MGNQLVGIAPSQIFPVEHYLTDLPEYAFDISLGSTRFLKVARAKFREGLIVVKVFAIHDPSFPLRIYKDQLEEIKAKLWNVPNCHPFQKFMVTERAGLLFRQYVKDNLYDRISTRPFLNAIEKKWIAFQILCSISQCHKMGVCHGDIKLENVMITGWNWVLLTDFASFKPTYLPEDNPADFSYFFDTSRRRTCYTAPERFLKTLNPDAGIAGGNMVLPDDEIKKGDLIPSMDIFSTGCALTELFTEGHAPFDLVQLLAYRNGEYSPWKILEKVEDVEIRDMLRHMMQKDPGHRWSAEEYLDTQRRKAFPEYFYSFLRNYMQGFAGFPITTPDEKIARLKHTLLQIIKILSSDNSDESDFRNEDDKDDRLEDEIQPVEGLVIIVSLITSCLRGLRHCTAKLSALEMMVTLTPYLSAEIILDRLTPYMLYLVNDAYPRVRVAALRSLTKCLTCVKSVPRSDANIFPEYILPNLAHLTQDEAVIVRIAFAENIAVLAETALRFLEMTQLDNNNDPTDTVEDGSIHYQASYDTELQALHEMIQQRVSTLLSDPDNIIKQTLMENGITRLCVFFGHQKANDVLMSHMITFLNDKEDRHLRGAFFDCIVGIAAYVGWQSSPILKPLLQQGLSDPEESVIVKAMDAMTNLTELGLLQKITIYELLTETAPFLCHPSLWIRHSAVGFICAVADNLNIADIHCKLLPVIIHFLKHPIIQVNKEVILLSALKDPVPRAVYDGVIRSPLITDFLDCLHERQLLRGITRIGHMPQYSEVDTPIRGLHRRLVSDCMTETVEDMLLMMRDCLLKVYKSRVGLEGKQRIGKDKDGFVDLSRLLHVPKHHVDLTRERNNASAGGEGYGQHHHPPLGQRMSAKKKVSSAIHDMAPIQTMNEDWHHMFGADMRNQSPAHLPPPQWGAPDSPLLMTQSLPQGTGNFAVTDGQTGDAGFPSPLPPNPVPQLSRESAIPPRSPNRFGSSDHLVTVLQKQTLVSSCQTELRELIYRKTNECNATMTAKESFVGLNLEARYPPPAWKPKGQLVAHLCEHRQAVNRVLAIPDSTLFATCSNDGTVKIYDCGRMESRSVANRARNSYTRQEGRITSLAVCHHSQALASASDNLTIHVFKYDLTGPKTTILHSRTLDPQEDGCVVDMNYFDAGSQSLLTYGTVYGAIYGWDLRSPGIAWKLQNDPQHGLITSYCVDPRHSWLVAGTVKGIHILWDIRFQLPISSLPHPAAARVTQLELHPQHPSWVVSAVYGNNEVTMWDMETGARQYTLWASSAPPLSQTQASDHSVHAMQVWPGDSSPVILTAGSDMRIRYWNLNVPSNSFIAMGAANEITNQSLVNYESRLIDGTEVIYETYSKPKEQGGGADDMPRRGPDMPPAGHNDCISDLAICQTPQVFVISGAKNGTVKVWK